MTKGQTRQLLLDQKQEIIARFNNGDNSKTIAKDYDVTDGTIRNYLKKWGIDTSKYSTANTSPLVQNKEEVIRLYKSGMKVKDIAAKFNVHRGSLHNMLKRYSIKTNVQQTIFTEKNKDEIIKLYTIDRLTCAQIAAKYGGNDETVRVALIKWGIDTARLREEYNVDRKHCFDEDFFEVINSPEKAYCLGFIIGDGCISKDLKRLTIQLKSTDDNILKQIAKLIQYKEDLIYGSGERKNTITYHVILALNSVKMVKDLGNLGVGPAKSFTATLPILDDKLMPHLIRGLFDADGWVCQDLKCSGIVGSHATITKLGEYLDSQNIKHSTIRKWSNHKDRKPEDSMYKLHIYDKQNQKNFLEYIYKDQTICLERKYKLAKELFDV